MAQKRVTVGIEYGGLQRWKDFQPFQGELKTLTEENYQRLKNNILRDNFNAAFDVWKHGGVMYTMDGHQRCRCLQKMEEEGYEIPQELPTNFITAKDKAQAKRILFSKMSQYGTVDSQGLYEQQIEAGITPDEMQANYNVPGLDMDLHNANYFSDQPKTDQMGNPLDDVVPEKPPAIAEPGQLWLLGEHRVLCGDSTKPKNIDFLMGGHRADMVFTDPPYGVSYTKKNEYLNSIGPGHRLTDAIENDEKTIPEMFGLWEAVFNVSATYSSDRASYYICSPQGGELMMMMMMMMQAIDQSPWALKHTLIWAKNNHVLGRCDYHYKHEPILYGWKKKGVHDFYGEGQHTKSVWEVPRPHNSDLHPTMKPVELMVNAIKNSSKKGQIVLDMFLGSGSTLMACEQTGRKCYGTEISPHYIDTTIKRWEDFTGQKAKKLT